MRKIIIITALVFIYINTVAQSKLFIDSKKSEFVWIGKKIGGEHKGNIIISSGELNVSKDNQILSASFEVDMGSKIGRASCRERV